MPAPLSTAAAEFDPAAGPQEPEQGRCPHHEAKKNEQREQVTCFFPDHHFTNAVFSRGPRMYKLVARAGGFKEASGTSSDWTRGSD